MTNCHQRGGRRYFSTGNWLKQMSLSASPPLKRSIENSVLRLKYSELWLAEWRDIIARYGDERIPEGPTPLPPEVYALWGPRFQKLGRAVVGIDGYGGIGEVIAASLLPGVVATNLGPHDLLPQMERNVLIQRANPEQRQWLSTINRENFEIDILFDNGSSIGEVKFAKQPVDRNSHAFKRIETQALKLQRLLQIFADQGINKEGYFRAFFISLDR